MKKFVSAIAALAVVGAMAVPAMAATNDEVIAAVKAAGATADQVTAASVPVTVASSCKVSPTNRLALSPLVIVTLTSSGSGSIEEIEEGNEEEGKVELPS